MIPRLKQIILIREIHVWYHARGSKSPQSSFDSCFGPALLSDHVGCDGFDGVRTPPMLGAANRGGEDTAGCIGCIGWSGCSGALGATGAEGTMGAGGSEML